MSRVQVKQPPSVDKSRARKPANQRARQGLLSAFSRQQIATTGRTPQSLVDEEDSHELLEREALLAADEVLRRPPVTGDNEDDALVKGHLAPTDRMSFNTSEGADPLFPAITSSLTVDRPSASGSTRRSIELRIGTDFPEVRIHIDDTAPGTDVPLASPSPETASPSRADTVSRPEGFEAPSTTPTLRDSSTTAVSNTALSGLTDAPVSEASEVEAEESPADSLDRTDTREPAESAEGHRERTSTPPEAPGRTGTGARTADNEASGKPPEAAGGDEAKADEAREAPSPREAIGPAISEVRQRATRARRHRPANASVASAQAAAQTPETEQTRNAAAGTVANLDEAKEGASEVSRSEFKRKLREAIDAATPRPTTESQAEHVMQTGARNASGALRGSLTAEQDAAVGPLRTAADAEVPPATQQAPPRTELQSEQVGSPPARVSGAPVVPAPLPPERLDYSSDRAPADQLMAENEVTQEQLEQGNEPGFGPALEARATAEEHEATTESRYREAESAVQESAEGRAQAALGQGLTAMHGVRGSQIGLVTGHQVGTMGRDAAERERVTNRINSIKDQTKSDVTSILDSMESEATRLFEEGLKSAEDAYEAAFEEAKGGVGTWLTTWGDDWKEHIEESLATARRKYLEEVNRAIDAVADCVDAKLAEAKRRVAAGRAEVEEFVRGLEGSVRQFGEEALQSVSGEFDAMTAEIDERRDGLIDSLTQQYKESYERMSAREEQLRSENKSLWERVYDATVGLVNKIIEFKNLLLGVLGRAADIIGDIIAHPIRFLGNLVTGVMQGLKNFLANIGTHLQQGLMGWLFGTMAEAGIQMPATFDLKGILSLVLQVLGLTYANIRARAVRILGEEMVSRLEQVAEIFKIMITQGPAGLWEYIKEKIGDLKTMVIDGIKSFVIEKVIISGITWVISLLNPASAFIKACKAIYDIIMFFVTRGSQILSLVNAVLDSLAAIASGAVAGVAAAVENALARALPVAISFLASLLGLGGISQKIREIIEKIQQPVNTTIDWVINKAVQMVKAAGKLFTGGSRKDDETPETDDPEHDAKLEAGLAEIDQEEQKYLEDGKITREHAEEVATKIKTEHPIFKSLTVVDGGERWDYQYTASSGRKQGETKEGGQELTEQEMWDKVVEGWSLERTPETRMDEQAVETARNQIEGILNSAGAAQAMTAVNQLLDRAKGARAGSAISTAMSAVSAVTNRALESVGSPIRVNAHHVQKVSEFPGTFVSTRRGRLYMKKAIRSELDSWLSATPSRPKEEQEEMVTLIRDQLMDDKHAGFEMPLEEIEMIVTTQQLHTRHHAKERAQRREEEQTLPNWRPLSPIDE